MSASPPPIDILGYSPIADDLEAAVRQADIVSTATLSPEPLIRGAWMAPGTHVDCVGAYRPNMRETDDEVFRAAEELGIDLSRREPSSVEEV